MTRHAALLLALASAVPAAEPLHREIDRLVAARAGKSPASALTDDAAFLRRVWLDFAGRIPSAAEARAILADTAADKRTKLVDRLLAGPDYPRRMQELFHVVLMERLGDHADWTAYLRTAFEENRPWDRMAREVLAASRKPDAPRGSAFFLSKRLENYGQNPVDYSALTRDVGRLFLGVNLQCAECHDHLFVGDYKQRDFQGLYAFVKNVSLAPGPTPGVQEKPTTQKVAFASVFEKVQKETGPRVPGLKEVPIPSFKPGDEFVTPPDRKTKAPGELKFSTLAALAAEVSRPDNTAFNRNIVNRLWFLLMGRGLVHPLDLHHADNPASHPELLDLLAKEFVAHKYDLKWMLRELALTQTYQRSSVLPRGQTNAGPELFLTAQERRVSAEQLFLSMLEATGNKGAPEALRAKFLRAFANAPREPEEDFSPSLRAALFVLNDEAVLGLLTPKPGNLAERLAKLADDWVADELYLSVLTRLPTDAEKAEVKALLAKHAARRPAALGQLAWALLASTEFCVNH